MIGNLEVYHAKVVEVQLPTRQGAVRLQIPEIVPEQTLEAVFYPLTFASGANHGLYFPVQVGDMVIALLDKSDFEIGYFLPAYPRVREMPDHITDHRFAVITPSDDRISINKNGDVLISNVDNHILMTIDGTIEMEIKSGGRIRLANGRAEMINSAGTKVILDGKVEIRNSSGSLKDLFDELVEKITFMLTEGGVMIPTYLDEVPKMPILLSKINALLK